MAKKSVANVIRTEIKREYLLEIADQVRRAFPDAWKAVTDQKLVGKRKACSAGLLRHFKIEQAFEEMTSSFGGMSFDGGLIPGTDIRNYQVLAKFGRVILGQASIAERGTLPKANMTRRAVVQLNFDFSNQPPLPGFVNPYPGLDNIFALLLKCRDAKNYGKCDELAIAVIDPSYDGFIFYEEIDQFIAGYSVATATAKKSSPKLRLRPGIKEYQPKEAGVNSDDQGQNNSGKAG